MASTYLTRTISDGSNTKSTFSAWVKRGALGTDQYLWVGTANGLNRGIINGDDCINWEHHYTSTWNNISGNWVIGFTNQKLGNGTDRLWAITWAGEGNNEKNALSFTDDGGETWEITFPSGESEKVYNLYVFI